MKTHRDRLDDAIDAVAARLTRVAGNDALAERIIHSLPERSIWSGWLCQSWAPRLAMIALVMVAGVMWTHRGPAGGSAGVSPLASTQPHAPVVALAAPVRELEPGRTPPLEPVEPLEPLVPGSDFDRSLAPIVAPEALELSPLAPDALEASEGLVLAPLALSDLPLTPDPVSPR